VNDESRKTWPNLVVHLLWLPCALLLVQCAARPSHPTANSTAASTATALSPTATHVRIAPTHSAVSTLPLVATTTPAASFTPSVPSSTPVPSATSTAPADGGPVIVYFRANVDLADPGQDIVLEWQSSGASNALLYALPASGQLPQSGFNVAPSGSYTYSIPGDARNAAEFLLWVQDDAERGASANLCVKLRCPVAWFFSPAPGVCASDLLASNAAQQHFQHGLMLWVEARDLIIVLYDDNTRTVRWEMFMDQWAEGQPESDPAIVPPTGLYQPVRGFGLVWREQPEVRERLGWAVEQEAGFQTLWQTTTLYKYNSIYLRAPDGNVWHLAPERSSWELLEVAGS